MDTQTQAPQDSRRLPQIDPETFSAINALDGFVGKAPLTRSEHQQATACFQHVLLTVERLQAENKGLRDTLTKKLAGQSPVGANPSEGAAQVEEVIENVFDKKVTRR